MEEASLQPALGQSNAVPFLGGLGVMGSHLPLLEVPATPLCWFGSCNAPAKVALGFGGVFLGSTKSRAAGAGQSVPALSFRVTEWD